MFLKGRLLAPKDSVSEILLQTLMEGKVYLTYHSVIIVSKVNERGAFRNGYKKIAKLRSFHFECGIF